MQVTSVSAFREATKKYFDQIIDNQDVLLITRNDGQTFVVMTLDEYNSKVETDYLNSSLANRRHLEASMAQLRAGKVITKTIEELKQYE